MSLRSMTGYGRGVASSEGLTATVEIGSVNRKQLDVSCSLPRGLNLLEARVIELVQSTVQRGRITVDVSLDWSGPARRKAVRIDQELAAAYLSTLRKAAADFGLKDDIRLDTLIGLPDVLHFARPQEDVEQVWKVLEKALRKALRALDGMRTAEGKSLQTDVQTRLRTLESFAQDISAQAPQVVKRYRTQLQQRLKDAGVPWSDLDERFIREIVLFTDRSDISEELTRLDSHFKQARTMTRAKTATGRSLDFLAQEMFREINTIGSKANDSQILQRVVDFKAELERIREQVQNIE